MTFPKSHVCGDQLWWETAPASLQATLWEVLQELPGNVPLLFVATADVCPDDLPCDALALFQTGLSYVIQLGPPSASEREAFFSGIVEALAAPPQPLPPPRPHLPPPQVGPFRIPVPLVLFYYCFFFSFCGLGCFCKGGGGVGLCGRYICHMRSRGFLPICPHSSRTFSVSLLACSSTPFPPRHDVGDSVIH